MSASWAEIEALYHLVLESPPSDRDALLAAADRDVRDEVVSLLQADAEPGLAAEPPSHLAADLVDCQPEGLAAGQRVASYEVQSLLSIGGMGEVYLAHDPQGHPVALKILRRHLIVNPHAVERFQMEARAASALCHPNIITVYESGDSRAGLYIAMEWLDGSTLRELMSAGPVDLDQAIDWGAQALRALDAAHAAGILHRDIKPENMMVRKDGVLKIVDFGLARPQARSGSEAPSTGSSGTISGTLSGTLLYMPPEILSGEAATSASDVFSLGALLYELLACQHPFAGDTPLDVYEAIECRDVPPPSALRRNIPARIDTLLLRMLSRTPADRPRAHEAAQILQAALQ